MLQEVSSSRATYLARVPSFEVVGSNAGFILNVGLHDHQALIDDRRAAKAPLLARKFGKSSDESAEIQLLEQVSIEVEAEEFFGSEEGDQMDAVGDGRRVGMAGLHMSPDLGHSFANDPLPDYPQCLGPGQK